MRVICKICGKEYSKYGIKNHISIAHDGKESWNKKRIPWNKGLTKDNDVRVKLQTDKFVNNLSTGKVKPTWKGKNISQETKNKISKSIIKYFENNPDKVPYLINHSSKMSYPEKIFKQALESSQISGWIYNYRNSIYQYDFAFPDLKIDVEIDGGTHLTEKVKKIDARRDEFSKSEGWKVLRFTAKEVKEDVILCIQKLNIIIS